ncbi:hypothetical protein ACE6H2_001869 [Prunus campanulata]
MGLKSPGSGSKTSLGSGGSRSGPGKPKRVMTVGELMRIQMGISDAMDSRVRRALLRISVAQCRTGKEVELIGSSVCCPIEEKMGVAQLLKFGGKGDNV